MRGTLYGVGVGPGDPELITIKAINTIKSCNVIAFPGEKSKNAVAYNIAAACIPEIQDKKHLPLDMPMSIDRTVLDQFHEKASNTIEAFLEKGEDVAFLVLGDVTIYSTFIYLQNIVKSHGYKTEIISGVTSFCASAAVCGISLCQWDENLIIIPSRHQLPERFEQGKNYVLMKAGNSLEAIRSKVIQCKREAVCIENCGMAEEKIHFGASNIPDKAGYYSIVIVK